MEEEEVEEKEVEEEEGKGEKEGKRGTLVGEVELQGTETHSLSGAVVELRQENATLRSELNKLMQLLQEKVQAEEEGMYVH